MKKMHTYLYGPAHPFDCLKFPFSPNATFTRFEQRPPTTQKVRNVVPDRTKRNPERRKKKWKMALSLPPAIASPQHRTPVRTPMHGPQNVGNVVLGNLRITPEYPSFYPEDLIGGRKAQWLYVCHWCFRYTHELMKYAAHCVSLSCLRR